MDEFRALHVPGTPLLLPNAWEFGVGAHLVAQGFRALGTTSLGVSAAAGSPTARRRRETRPSRWPPGWPGSTRWSASTSPTASARTRPPSPTWPKSSPRRARSASTSRTAAPTLLAPVDVQAALVAAVKERAPRLFVNARTDTHWAGDRSVAEAETRARAYVAAGADGVFVPGLAAPADVERIVAVGVPLNLLFLPGKVTLAGLAELGVARVSLGSLPYRMALAAAAETALAVRDGRDLPLTPPSYADVTAFL